MVYKVLSIAGFDGSGGAGIQADLKTFSALGCYGMTVLTALPVQNTCGVKICYEIPVQAIKDQLQAIFEDILPDSIKIGMLFTHEIIESVASFLRTHALNIPVVLDPITLAKSGDPLLLPNAIDTLMMQLMPLTTLITPNIPEAETFTGLAIENCDAMHAAAKKLLDYGPQYVLLKGGHLNSLESNDLLLSNDTEHWLTGKRINSKNTHGTGCTLSAAIACYLAEGATMIDACEKAKDYLTNALAAAKDLNIGKGNGPVHHFYNNWRKHSRGM